MFVFARPFLLVLFSFTFLPCDTLALVATIGREIVREHGRVSGFCVVTTWSFQVHSLGLLQVEVQLGLQWQPRGRERSGAVVATWNLHVLHLRLVAELFELDCHYVGV